MSEDNPTPMSPVFSGQDEDCKYQLVVPGAQFGNHCLTTGPISVPFKPARPTKCRVIAFNWAAHPEIGFHSCN